MDRDCLTDISVLTRCRAVVLSPEDDSLSSLCIHRSVWWSRMRPSGCRWKRMAAEHTNRDRRETTVWSNLGRKNRRHARKEAASAVESRRFIDFSQIFCTLFPALWTCTVPHKSKSSCVTPAVDSQHGFHPWLTDLYRTNNQCQNKSAWRPELLAPASLQFSDLPSVSTLLV